MKVNPLKSARNQKGCIFLCNIPLSRLMEKIKKLMEQMKQIFKSGTSDHEYTDFRVCLERAKQAKKANAVKIIWRVSMLLLLLLQ